MKNTQDVAGKSNPFSTGSGGARFENQVQAYFCAHFLAEASCPALNDDQKITQIRLQARPKYQTDDAVISVRNSQGLETSLLVQIKHKLTFTESDGAYQETLKAAWHDFSAKTFNQSEDKIILATGMVAQSVIDHVRPIFEFARTALNTKDFLETLNSSKEKKEKHEAIKNIIKNTDNKITDEAIWKFCKVLHHLSFDLDYASQSKDQSAIFNLLKTKDSKTSSSYIWNKILTVVADFNQTAGTLTWSTIDYSLLNHFPKVREIEASYLRDPNHWSVKILDSENEDWKLVRNASDSKDYIINTRDETFRLEFPSTFVSPISSFFFHFHASSLEKLEKTSINIFHNNNLCAEIKIAFSFRITKETIQPIYLWALADSEHNPIVNELNSKIAQIAGEVYSFQDITESDALLKFPLKTIKMPIFDMYKLRKVIEDEDISGLKRIVSIAKSYQDTAWLTYIFKKNSICYRARKPKLSQEGNIINLMIESRFEAGLQLILNSYSGEELDLSQYNTTTGKTPLLASVQYFTELTDENWFEIVNLLLDRKANPNQATRNDIPRWSGISPLQFLIEKATCGYSERKTKPDHIFEQYFQLVNHLLEVDADPNFKDSYEHAHAAATPLETIVSNYPIESVSNQKDYQGSYLKTHALMKRITKALVDRGAIIENLQEESKQKMIKDLLTTEEHSKETDSVKEKSIILPLKRKSSEDEISLSENQKKRNLKGGEVNFFASPSSSHNAQDLDLLSQTAQSYCRLQ